GAGDSFAAATPAMSESGQQRMARSNGELAGFDTVAERRRIKAIEPEAADLAFRIHEKADRSARGAWQHDVVRAVECDPIPFATTNQRGARRDEVGAGG